MRVFGRWLTLAVSILILASCSTGGSPNFVPGETAPDFSLHDLDGKEQHLSDYKGKIVLLNFWASWCGPCVGELPALQRLQARLQSKGLVVLGVGVDDDRDSLSDFRRAYNLSYPTVVDPARSLKRNYKLSGVPESFFIDRDGKFMMIPDPLNNEPVVRIVGPREWDSPTMIARINALLTQ